MKAGYISIIGRPNVGKSTLLNRLIGVKLSAVTKKPQTTRNRILGILTEGDCQCYFLDTPGLIKPEYELQQLMVEQIKIGIRSADIVLWVTTPWFSESEFPKDLFLPKRPSVLIAAINKIDLVKKSDLLPVMNKLKDFGPDEILLISALTGEGIDELKKVLFSYLPEGPFLYPEDDLSDRPERFFVAELIREEIFRTFKEEIPYATCVVIEDFKERKKGKDFIRATIYVEKESQRKIIIGKDGAGIKQIGANARKGIEEFLGRAVYLELWVKVKPHWRKNKRFLKELGY
ncbi:GTPase Era [candidate division WOR-3 bacterium 4484_100]|uniref:GTPase Era n=1 Tax=candidate division WOR-3 bacterium 4484_100 TaxID=1936077 RepID=A0A1V4QEQ9_UNCW3|nr:MAG: GTPase Era [candidate division WOR-3 bacterium 4484_100]